MIKHKQLKLFNRSECIDLNTIKLNLFSFIRRNYVTNINKYSNEIVHKQKYILNIIKPEKFIPKISILSQKSLKRYMCYNIGYEIHQYLLLIGVDKNFNIIYDQKFLLNSLNYRKMIYHLMLNNVEHVLIAYNLLNRSSKTTKQDYNNIHELFNIDLINDLQDILNISNIEVVDYCVIIKNKLYSLKQQK